MRTVTRRSILTRECNTPCPLLSDCQIVTQTCLPPAVVCSLEQVSDYNLHSVILTLSLTFGKCLKIFLEPQSCFLISEKTTTNAETTVSAAVLEARDDDKQRVHSGEPLRLCLEYDNVYFLLLNTCSHDHSS